jgi:hypothetical protein
MGPPILVVAAVLVAIQVEILVLVAQVARVL